MGNPTELYDPLLEEGLPAWPEAERTILGSILLDNKHIEETQKHLKPSRFHLSSHQHIYRAMLSIYQKGYVIDLFTLERELRPRMGWHEIGGATYISLLIDYAVHDISPHLRMVVDAAIARYQVKVAYGLGSLAVQGDIHKTQRFAERAFRRIHAAVNRDVAAESILKFHTAKEIAEQTPTSPEWIALPWVAKGAITELDGKIKAAGKTTFVTHLCRQVIRGEPFLGQSTKKSIIVYLSEQSPNTFRETLRRASLLNCEDLIVLFWHSTRDLSWPEIVKAAVNECERLGAEMLVIDTLSQFTGLRGDAENNSGDALLAIEPLQTVAAQGLAVVIIRHERKGGGDVGDSARGSSAFAGAVDIVLQIRRVEGNTRSTIRVIKALSRFDETPDSLVVELTAEGYVSLGSETALAEEEAKDAILKIVPDSEGNAIALDKILEAAELRRTVTQGAIRLLINSRQLQRVGKGKKGDSYRYYRLTTDAKIPEQS